MELILSYIPQHIRIFVSPALAVIYVAISILAAGHILFNKRDVRSSIGWIALVFLSPFLGTLAYILFGINRVSKKAVRLRRRNKENEIKSSIEIEKNLGSFIYANQMITYGRNVYPQELCVGNSIEPLLNGTQAYPEMLKAIRNSKKEVLIESYIFDSDDETDKFIDAFSQAAANGAKIKVLIDGIGTLKFFRRNIEKKLKTIKGLKYAVFLPPQIPIAMPFVNLRNHRKIMLIDGKTAFFGGMNLSKNNVLIDDKKRGVLDITFKVEGPLIDQISEVFEDDWEFAAKESFLACDYDMSQATPAGNIPARVIPNGPDDKRNLIDLTIHGAINFALKKIIVLTPYFLPENHILTALEMASMRGISVEIIIPQISDHLIMSWAEKYNFKRLIQRGVKIYRVAPPFDHSKIFIVDDEWAFIGSANWDVRSFRLHFEANIEVFDRDFVKKLFDITQKKKEKARLSTMQDCDSAGFFERLRANAFHLFTPYY
ncbi:MAG: phospholipase D-like domain-containing protein [Elusimicrobiota bacterium]|jgi:cardiolipin synthase|nr:phospholipase D-like domain-containing protein [Elusimicrobiota bacterium]